MMNDLCTLVLIFLQAAEARCRLCGARAGRRAPTRRPAPRSRRAHTSRRANPVSTADRPHLIAVPSTGGAAKTQSVHSTPADPCTFCGGDGQDPTTSCQVCLRTSHLVCAGEDHVSRTLLCPECDEDDQAQMERDVFDDSDWDGSETTDTESQWETRKRKKTDKSTRPRKRRESSTAPPVPPRPQWRLAGAQASPAVVPPAPRLVNVETNPGPARTFGLVQCIIPPQWMSVIVDHSDVRIPDGYLTRVKVRRVGDLLCCEDGPLAGATIPLDSAWPIQSCRGQAWTAGRTFKHDAKKFEVFGDTFAMLESAEAYRLCQLGDVSMTPPSMGPAVQVLVKLLNGRTFAVDVQSSGTVDQVKHQVEAREGIPAHQQCITHNSKDVNATRPLSYYGIGAGSTLEVSLRLRGGMPVGLSGWAVPATLTNGAVKFIPRSLLAATDVWLGERKLGILVGSGDDRSNRDRCHRRIRKVLRHFERHPGDAFEVVVFADRSMGWTSASVRELRVLASEDAEGRVVITRSGMESSCSDRVAATPITSGPHHLSLIRTSEQPGMGEQGEPAEEKEGPCPLHSSAVSGSGPNASPRSALGGVAAVIPGGPAVPLDVYLSGSAVHAAQQKGMQEVDADRADDIEPGSTALTTMLGEPLVQVPTDTAPIAPHSNAVIDQAHDLSESKEDDASAVRELRALARERSRAATTDDRQQAIVHRMRELRLDINDDPLFESIVCAGLLGGMEKAGVRAAVQPDDKKFSPVPGHIDHELLAWFHDHREAVAFLDELWGKPSNISTPSKRRECANRFYQRFPSGRVLLSWDRMPAWVVHGRCIPWWMGGELDRKGFIDQHRQFLHRLHLEMEAFEDNDALEELARVELERLQAAPVISVVVPRMRPAIVKKEALGEDSREEDQTAAIIPELRALVRERDDLAIGRRTRAALKRQDAIVQRLRELSLALADEVLFESIVGTGLRGGIESATSSGAVSAQEEKAQECNRLTYPTAPATTLDASPAHPNHIGDQHASPIVAPPCPRRAASAPHFTSLRGHAVPVINPVDFCSVRRFEMMYPTLFRRRAPQQTMILSADAAVQMNAFNAIFTHPVHGDEFRRRLSDDYNQRCAHSCRAWVMRSECRS